MQFGKGACVNLPLRIRATPRCEPNSEPFRVPDQWNPVGGLADTACLFLANPNEKTEFMTKFIDRNWSRWATYIEPLLVQVEEEQSKTVARRRTIKMYEDDPDEETKQNPFQPQAESFAEQVFAPDGQPQEQQAYEPPQPAQEQPVQQQAEPSFYDQFLKGNANMESDAAQLESQ